LAVPKGLYLVPLFYFWKKLNLIDTLPGIILIYSARFLPFYVLFLRSFFVKIPDDLIGSARIDGCSDIQMLVRIILPICRPAVLTVILLAGLETWNEFFFANAFLHSDENRTVATRYLAFTGQYMSQWPMIFSAGLITLLPFILLYLVLQRHFIEGLTTGSVVG